MTKRYPYSQEETKRLCEGVIRFGEHHSMGGGPGQLKPLTEEQLDALQWAKEFMERYERKNSKIKSQGSRIDTKHCELDRSK